MFVKKMCRLHPAILATFFLSMTILVGGGWSISSILHRMHRTEMRQKIRNGAEGVLLTLTDEAFQCSQISGGEIEIDGKFYDIISISNSGDRWIINALPDSKENLFQDLKKSRHGRDILHHIAKIFTPLFIHENHIDLRCAGYISVNENHCRIQEIQSDFNPLELFAPPDEYF